MATCGDSSAGWVGAVMPTKCSGTKGSSQANNKNYYCIITWKPEAHKGCLDNKTWTKYTGCAKLTDKTIAGDTKYVNKLEDGWNPPFAVNQPTVLSTVEETLPVPLGWNPELAVNVPIEPSKCHVECICEEKDNVDPVYASAKLFVGSGIGYNRSKTIICHVDDMISNQPGTASCPDRSSEYLIHINRLTESFPRRGTELWKKPRS